MVYTTPSDSSSTPTISWSSFSTIPDWDYTGHNAYLSISLENWFLPQGFCSFCSLPECFSSHVLHGLCPHFISPLCSYHSRRSFLTTASRIVLQPISLFPPQNSSYHLLLCNIAMYVFVYCFIMTCLFHWNINSLSRDIFCHLVPCPQGPGSAYHTGDSKNLMNRNYNTGMFFLTYIIHVKYPNLEINSALFLKSHLKLL